MFRFYSGQLQNMSLSCKMWSHCSKCDISFFFDNFSRRNVQGGSFGKNKTESWKWSNIVCTLLFAVQIYAACLNQEFFHVCLRIHKLCQGLDNINDDQTQNKNTETINIFEKWWTEIILNPCFGTMGNWQEQVTCMLYFA